MANEYFKSGTLTGMVQAFKPDPTSVTAALFPSRKKTPTDYYEFDVVSGSRHKADFRLPDSPAGIQKTTSKTRKKVLMANVREKKMLKESTLRMLDAAGKRGPDTAKRIISDELKDLDAIVERTWEWMRWQLMTTGGFTLTGDYDLVYSFGMTSTATASPIWTLPATATPLANVQTWKHLVEKASGDKAVEIWLSSAGLKYLMETAEALAVLGEATKDKWAETGTVAKIMDMNVRIVDGGWTNESGTFSYWLSDDGTAGNMAIIKCAGELGEQVDGPAVDSKAPDSLLGKFSKSWTEEDPAGRQILITQQSIIGLEQPNKIGAFTLW